MKYGKTFELVTMRGFLVSNVVESINDIQNPDCCSFFELLDCLNNNDVDDLKGVFVERRNKDGDKIKKAWSVEDVRLSADKRRIDFLIGCADATKPDVSVKDLVTNNRQIAKKGPNGGIEFFSHATIYAHSNNKFANISLTRCPGIDTSVVRALLAKIVKLIYEKNNQALPFYFAEPGPIYDQNGNIVNYQVSYKFKVYALPNDTFQEAVLSGRLAGIDVITVVPNDTDQGEHALELQSHIFCVDVLKPKAFRSVRDLVRKLKSATGLKISDNAHKLKVRYFPTDVENESSKTGTVKELEKAFSTKHRIELDVEASQGGDDDVVLCDVLMDITYKEVRNHDEEN